MRAMVMDGDRVEVQHAGPVEAEYIDTWYFIPYHFTMKLKGNARDWQLRFRLWAAILLISYALGYYAYYVIGLFDLELMEAYENTLGKLLPLFWIFPLVLMVHVSLGLWKLYKRNTFKMPLWEKAQIILGLSIPFFYLPHIIYTYGVYLFFGSKQDYVSEILATFPLFGWQFVAMTLIIWAHAQIGAHVVLRMRKWYPRAQLGIILLFSLMPLFGIAGYIKSGSDLTVLVAQQKETNELRSPPELQTITRAAYSTYIIFPAIYLFVFGGRAMRIHQRNKNKNVQLRYRSGELTSVFSGTTILEASRLAGVPHASICGGRGRCTTCRVKVEDGMENLSPIAEREFKALRRIEAEKDVRLACQAECIRGTISVTLLLPPDVKSYSARKEDKLSVGKELNLAVMFIDLRGFTRLSEEKLPYDVVFILNNYFNTMGEIIERHNGTIDKFLGDGILAYFGVEGTAEQACDSALQTAIEMDDKLRSINEHMKNAVNEELEIGIGIHYGEVILGKLGYKNNSAMTIIGDTVNTASRLDSLNKKVGSRLIFSKVVGDQSKINLAHLKTYKVMVRGRKVALEIHVVKDIARELGTTYTT